MQCWHVESCSERNFAPALSAAPPQQFAVAAAVPMSILFTLLYLDSCRAPAGLPRCSNCGRCTDLLLATRSTWPRSTCSDNSNGWHTQFADIYADNAFTPMDLAFRDVFPSLSEHIVYRLLVYIVSYSCMLTHLYTMLTRSYGSVIFAKFCSDVML